MCAFPYEKSSGNSKSNLSIGSRRWTDHSDTSFLLTFMKNIIETAVNLGTCKILVSALHIAKMGDLCTGPGPYTLFAPTDAAFGKYTPAELQALLGNASTLEQVLKFHLFEGLAPVATVAQFTFMRTLQGAKLVIADVGDLTVNGAKITSPDIACSNGVVHCVDTVFQLAREEQ